LKTGSRELSKCKLDLAGVQEVRCDKDKAKKADDLYILLRKWEL
jgi:hypothetical protein